MNSMNTNFDILRTGLLPQENTDGRTGWQTPHLLVKLEKPYILPRILMA